MKDVQVLLDNRDGRVWDVGSICPEFSWKTSRSAKPSSVDMTLMKDALFQQREFEVGSGDIVRITVDGKGLFYGYVFELEQGKGATVKIKAYDQIRYLNEQDFYLRTNVTADQVIRDNALSAGLRLGELTPTYHVIPKVLEEGQKRIDIICKALDSTLLAKNRLYVLYDDFGSLRLSEVSDMRTDLVLGDGSLIYDFRMKRSIDNATFNRIKLAQEDNASGMLRTYVDGDPDTIGQWGRLQYYKKVDGGMNQEQIREMIGTLLLLRNREERTFSIEALGYPGVRAGVLLQVSLTGEDVNGLFLVEECTHRFAGGAHTMKLEMKVYG